MNNIVKSPLSGFGSRLRPRRGFTLVEVMVAGLLLVLITGAVVGGVMHSLRIGHFNRMRLAAAGQANALIEELHNTAYYRIGFRTTDNQAYINNVVLKTGDTYSATEDVLFSRKVRLSEAAQDDTKTPIIADCKVYAYAPNRYWNGTAWTTTTLTGPTYKRIAIVIQWTFMGKPQTYRAYTTVSGLDTYDPVESESYDDWIPVDGD